MTDIPPIIKNSAPEARAQSTTTTEVVTPASTPAYSSPLDMQKKTKKTNKALKIFVSVLSVLLILVTIAGTAGFFLVYVPGKKLYTQAMALKDDAKLLQDAVAQKDLKKTQSEIDNLKNKIKSLDVSLSRFAYLSAVPRAKDYYADAKRMISVSLEGLDTGTVLIQTIEPYQDFLGLKGTATSSAKTTEDRITFLTNSIEGLVPHLDTIDKKITKISATLNEIDINRYPAEYKGIAIHDKFNQLSATLSQVQKYLDNGKPLLSKTSWLLGKDKPRSYLVIFQNEGELRPSGGFWTAYATLKMDKGKVVPGPASNIYDLDDKLQSQVPAPRLIKSYHINVPYLNLRDSNLSPDFPTDAKIFMDTYYKTMGKKDTFDAVVAIDTNVLVDLVGVLGKLDTRVGTFTTEPDKRCDGCPKIIYDLEWISGRPRNYIEKNRKDFLAPLMQALLSNALGSEKTKIPLLGEAFFNNVNEKHILFYFPDEELQKSASLINITGNITQSDANTDYFHLNDANFASAKSNIFIRQKIKHEITVTGDKVEHKVTTTYTNPSAGSNCNLEKGDLCLNAPKYRDLFRFYVPKGSELIKLTGSEVEPLVYEELGKTVFEGFYGDKYPLYAKSSSKTTVNYKSSVKMSPNYSLLLQKQPGTKPIDYEVWVNGKQKESFVWNSDKTLKITP
ncbi:MAG: DUF4012 domain-containing protein [Candidatus Shapirobacteria bacterium]|jgi:hypothetical protein